MTQTSPKPTNQATTDSRVTKSFIDVSVSSERSGLNNSTPDLKRLTSELPPAELQPEISVAPSPGRKSSLIQWFYDLPISRKQAIALIASQLVSLGGVVIGGRIIITNSLQTQLKNQANSEVAVTATNYNIKLNQMGFGFRGQSENPAIIAAAKTKTLTPELQNQVKQILKNEIKARKIEYATLVDRNLRIIVNANANRSGEVFNPNKLVSKVFTNNQQIKSSEIVSWSELAKESPPLPSKFPHQAALIRYTVTPVLDPETKTIIGALVSGDVVNGKLPIVEETLKAFKGGYSAVYLRQPTGEFTLATALDQANATDLKQAKVNVALPNSSLLTAAIAAQGQPVSQRIDVGTQTYTLAAKTIAKFSGEPVAILVRGTPETALNNLLNQSLLEEITVLLLALLVIGSWAIILKRTIVQPIEQLQQTTQKYAQGDREVRAEVLGADEIGKLAATFNQMAESNIQSQISFQEQVKRKERYDKQSQLYADVVAYRATQLQELNPILNEAVEKARDILNADRVVIYLFNFDWSGYIANESVLPGWPRALADKIEDPCIGEQLIEAYKNGRVVPTNDVFKAGFSPEHLELMKRLKIKSNLVTPILKNNQLFGLLIAHHCSEIHIWQEYEITFLKQLSDTIGLALDRVSLLEQKEAEADRLGILREITVRISRTPKLEDIFNTAVQEIRLALKTNRVVVYGLDPTSWKGTVIAESVADGWPKSLGIEIDDPCLRQGQVERFKQGQVTKINDIYQEPRVTGCYRKQLEQFAVKANLVAPLLQGEQLLGLLIAHQCDRPRTWQQPEIDLFTQLATQVGFALDIAALLEQQRIAKEQLQKRALELLMEVDPVSKGDLSIRASVTEDEIGTVANSYNTTIGSLQKIVTQVQTAAQQVAVTTSKNEVFVSNLSKEALRQAQEVAVALNQIQALSNSIAAVAANAEQAEAAVLQASQTVEAGDAAMNRTVGGILAIRETVTETSIKVKRLGESSQRISKIVKLIGRFTAQTNLLALKASIEAARAGEEGRGFAVLADEVRALAGQSAEATAEIESLVAAIQSETNEVVAAMEAGTQQVAEGTKLVDETRQSLNKISAASAQINRLVEAISIAAVAQSQTSDAVGQTMTDVAAIASKTSNEVIVVSASFKELLAVAQELQTSVGQFKVS